MHNASTTCISQARHDPGPTNDGWGPELAVTQNNEPLSALNMYFLTSGIGGPP
jgi:hypothetical protein